jgi:hypothetical protein
LTLADLQVAGYTDEICEAVDCLTRRPGESYSDMITRVEANPLARRVKLADLEDNMDPNRRLDGTEGAERLAKYQAAWKRLSEIR